MTLSRERWKIYFECDGKRCANVLETPATTIAEAREDFVESGWIARRTANAWFDICPDCQEREGGCLDLTPGVKR